MKRFSIKKIVGALLLSGAMVAPTVQAAPSIALKVTAPKGTAGEVPNKYVKGATWTPCITAPVATTSGYSYLKLKKNIDVTLDGLEFELSIKNEPLDPKKKTDPMAYDTYVMFMSADGTTLFNLEQGFYGMGLVPYDLNTILPFKAAANFLPNDKKIKLFGSAVPVDINIPQGLWSVVAFMIKAGETDIANAKNWEAFAVAPVVLGSPIASSGTVCDSANVVTAPQSVPDTDAPVLNGAPSYDEDVLTYTIHFDEPVVAPAGVVALRSAIKINGSALTPSDTVAIVDGELVITFVVNEEVTAFTIAAGALTDEAGNPTEAIVYPEPEE